MEFHKDAVRFGELSSRYRRFVANGIEDQAREVYKEIKDLISFSAERIGRVFKVKLHKRASSFDRGVGIPMVALSIPKIISKRGHLKPRDLTTFNVKKEKSLHGLNIIMDYSGSMWFTEVYAPNSTIGKLMRIHAQNFLALVLGVYLQRLSKGKLRIAYTVFSETAMTDVYNDVMNADWDKYILHRFWGSHNGENWNESEENEDLLPKSMSHCDRDWFCNVYPREAFIQSKQEFTNHKLTDFINVLFTDGGMHRIGETQEDRKKFLRQALKSMSEEELGFAYIIREQDRDMWFRQMVTEIGLKNSVVNEESDYDKAFDYLFHLINEVRKV